jgi:hypothetical protein
MGQVQNQFEASEKVTLRQEKKWPTNDNRELVIQIYNTKQKQITQQLLAPGKRKVVLEK